jgi:arylsulfatase A-like enzyme
LESVQNGRAMFMQHKIDVYLPTRSHAEPMSRRHAAEPPVAGSRWLPGGRRRALAGAACLGLLAGAGAGCRGERQVALTPKLHASQCSGCNVLLISVDTLRADHLHAYGYDRPTSPNIDRLAREAVLFEQNINTGGGTLPVHVSMFTSLPPTVHGVWADSGRSLDRQRITLADQLHAAGYRTGAFTGGGFVSSSFGLAKGFDDFDELGGGLRAELPRLYGWLDRHQGGKLFLFLHTYDVHSGTDKLPYDHGDAWNRRFTDPAKGHFDGCRAGKCASELLASVNQQIAAGKLRAADAFSPDEIEYMKGLYDGGIGYADAELEGLFDQLRARGLWDTTLIVLTADHGEEFAEHGLFLHHQNHEEVARIPLLVRFPRGQFGGRRISGLVSTLEIMPTILDAVGVGANPEVMGKSVMPLIAGDPGRAGLPWVYMAGALEKLRTPAWALFADRRGPVELYDVQHDPGETTDVLASHAETAASLYDHYLDARRRDLWARHSLPAHGDSAARPAAAERAHLRALGYVE